MLILDFNGANGGVGRCTIQIVRQLEAGAIPVLLTGLDELMCRFPARLSDLEKIHIRSLDRPRFGLNHLHLRHLRKSTGDRGRYTDLVIRLARKKGRELLPPEHCGLLVNHPMCVQPPRGERGFAVLIHDLNWLHYPGNFDDPARTDEWCRAWVESAGKVVTNSEFTRRDILEQYGCAPDKVVAAPLAPFAEPHVNGASSGDAVMSRLGVAPGKFFLYPNGWGLHKGFDILTDALEQTGDMDPVVVTCGKFLGHAPAIWNLYSSLQERWKRLVEQRKLIVSDRLSEPEIQALRLHCRAFVLPNRFEGFGFPMAEAIYQHRPAIVSEIPAHREILDHYPRYRLARTFSPAAPETLAAELRNFRTEPASVPDDWHVYLESTWSWRHTVKKISQAISAG